MNDRRGDNQIWIDGLKAALADGTLTYAELERRIVALVDEELSRPAGEIDMQFITVCEDLLWEVNSSTTYVSNKDEHKKALLARLQATDEPSDVKKHRPFIRKVFVAFAGIIAAFMLITLGNNIFGHSWLIGTSTEDTEQYIINGKEIDPRFIVDGTADGVGVFAKVETTDLEEVKALLGYTPEVPTWLPAGWVLHHYTAQLFPTKENFACMYANKSDADTLLYEVTKYSDAEYAYMVMEQSRVGKTAQITGSQTAYVSYNSGRLLGVWFDGLTSSSISGNVTEMDFVKIVKSVWRN